MLVKNRLNLLEQSALYKKRQNNKPINKYVALKRLKPVTVIIAAICNVDLPGVFPAIVFCADR